MVNYIPAAQVHPWPWMSLNWPSTGDVGGPRRGCTGDFPGLACSLFTLVGRGTLARAYVLVSSPR